MSIIFMWFAAILPPLLLWIYIWKHDAQPEPTGQLLKAVLFGVGIIIPVALLENVIEFFLLGEGATTLLGTTIDAFFVAALPEESFKLLALWLVLRRNRYFDEHYDGIVYAVCLGLGCAAVDNIFYVFADDNWAGVAILRALLAVPGHYAFAVMMGYYYSLYHFVDRSPQTAACVLLVPFVGHGVYDALVMSASVDKVVGGISFLVLIFFCIKLHKAARSKVVAQIERDKQDGNRC